MEALVREFLAVLKANTLAGRSITGLMKVCQPRFVQIYADFGRIRVNTLDQWSWVRLRVAGSAPVVLAK